MAAKDTFALKIAVWFRRGRLLLWLPLPSHLRPGKKNFSLSLFLNSRGTSLLMVDWEDVLLLAEASRRFPESRS